MRTIYVTPQSAQLPPPLNQLTAYNIKVSSFVKIIKTRLNHHHHADCRHFFVYLAFTLHDECNIAF
jgi:hypothetical protein